MRSLPTPATQPLPPTPPPKQLHDFLCNVQHSFEFFDSTGSGALNLDDINNALAHAGAWWMDLDGGLGTGWGAARVVCCYGNECACSERAVFGVSIAYLLHNYCMTRCCTRTAKPSHSAPTPPPLHRLSQATSWTAPRCRPCSSGSTPPAAAPWAWPSSWRWRCSCGGAWGRFGVAFASHSRESRGRGLPCAAVGPALYLGMLLPSTPRCTWQPLSTHAPPHKAPRIAHPHPQRDRHFQRIRCVAVGNDQAVLQPVSVRQLTLHL